jgi:hypothetical protein
LRRSCDLDTPQRLVRESTGSRYVYRPSSAGDAGYVLRQEESMRRGLWTVPCSFALWSTLIATAWAAAPKRLFQNPILASAGCDGANASSSLLDDTLRCIASSALLASHRLARPRARGASFETASNPNSKPILPTTQKESGAYRSFAKSSLASSTEPPRAPT